MKKNLLFAILCVLGLFGALNAQEVVTIDGTVGGREVTTSKNVPAFCANMWAITQQFYTAEEIGKSSGTIESIAFKTAAVDTEAEKYPFTRNLEIYMSNSENYAIVGNSMRAMSASELVFSGEVEFAYNAWVSIDITDFEYTGENVLICVNDVTGSNVSGGISFDAFKHSVTINGDNANRALYKRSTSSAFNATTAVTGASQNAPVPFVQFAFAAGTTEEYQEPVAPTNFVATVLSESKVQLSWEGSEDNSSYNVYQGTDKIANVTETSYTVKNLVPGEYYFEVKAANGPKESTGVSANVTIVAKTVKSITIGQAWDGDSNTAPMSLCNMKEPEKLDSWVEQIYTAEEIGQACTIERLSFPIKCTSADVAEENRIKITTKEIKIYLAETTRTDCADQAWTAAEDLKLVYSDTDIIIGDQEWETFEFTTPFNYSGEKNLAVVVAKSAEESTGMYLWHTNSVSGTVLYSNETSSYPSSPGNVTNTRPVVRFAWESTEGGNEGEEGGNEGEEGGEEGGNEGEEGGEDTPEIETGNYQTAFYYDFENGSLKGWNVIDANEDKVKWQYKNGADGGGFKDGGGVYSGIWNGGKADDYLVTATKYSMTTTSEISFMFVPYDCLTNFHEKIAVVVSEDGETFERVWSYEIEEAVRVWDTATIDLSAYAGKDLYLGLHHYGSEDGLRVDNIRLYSEEPGTPSNLKATATETTVTLTWDAVYDVKSYNVYLVTTKVVEEVETLDYTLLADGLTATTYTAEDLTAGKEYKFTVTSVNDFKESQYANVVTVNTTSSEGIEEFASSFSVYPNPVNDVLFIETEVEINEVVVYTITGVIAGQQSTVNGQQATIDVANLNSGVYFVKVVTENGEVVKRFVKK